MTPEERIRIERYNARQEALKAGAAMEAWDVQMMLANPIYAGVGEYPAMVTDAEWIEAAMRSIEERGVAVFLGDVLTTLRGSVGFVDA